MPSPQKPWYEHIVWRHLPNFITFALAGVGLWATMNAQIAANKTGIELLNFRIDMTASSDRVDALEQRIERNERDIQGIDG